MNLVKWPDEILLKRASNVSDISDAIEDINDSVQVMRDNNGLGLAAPQVGISKRFFILDEARLSEIDEREPSGEILVMINPVILDGFGEIVSQEGCLSVPGEIFNVPRASFITVRFQDIDGRDRKEDFSGLTAIVIQHEHDHLDGIVLVERESLERRRDIREKLSA